MKCGRLDSVKPGSIMLMTKSDKFGSVWYRVLFIRACDMDVLQVAHEVNGPMLELLASEIEHHDAACINSFRYGAPLFGVLPVSGNGILVNLEEGQDPDAVRKGCSKRNEKVCGACYDGRGADCSFCV